MIDLSSARACLRAAFMPTPSVSPLPSSATLEEAIALLDREATLLEEAAKEMSLADVVHNITREV